MARTDALCRGVEEGHGQHDELDDHPILQLGPPGTEPHVSRRGSGCSPWWPWVSLLAVFLLLAVGVHVCFRHRRVPNPLGIACPNMQKVEFIVGDSKSTATGLASGDIKLFGCSNVAVSSVGGKTGVVLFLHGACLSADDYATVYPDHVHLPDDYNIVFLNTPYSNKKWMENIHQLPLDDHWNTTQLEYSVALVSNVVDQLAALYGGYDRVWIAGFSQGAVISSTVALRGNSHVLAGAFIVAGYPPRPLYTDHVGALPLPTEWTEEIAEKKKLTKIYFYTGAEDHHLDLHESFCRYKRVVDRYGLDPANYQFWSKLGDSHGSISPNGNEFQALWHLVRGETHAVENVEVATPDKKCT